MLRSSFYVLTVGLKKKITQNILKTYRVANKSENIVLSESPYVEGKLRPRIGTGVKNGTRTAPRNPCIYAIENKVGQVRGGVPVLRVDSSRLLSSPSSPRGR